LEKFPNIFRKFSYLLTEFTVITYLASVNLLINAFACRKYKNDGLSFTLGFLEFFQLAVLGLFFVYFHLLWSVTIEKCSEKYWWWDSNRVLKPDHTRSDRCFSWRNFWFSLQIIGWASQEGEGSQERHDRHPHRRPQWLPGGPPLLPTPC